METNGLFNFLLPLRAKTRSTDQMRPIILLFKKRFINKRKLISCTSFVFNHLRPSKEYLKTISCFPLVFYIEGEITEYKINFIICNKKNLIIFSI
jgi:hypothetical protein